MLKTSPVELGVCWTIYVENLEGDGLFHTGPSLTPDMTHLICYLVRLGPRPQRIVVLPW